MIRVVSNPSNSNTVTIECDFIKNSDAQGCMVVLEGEVDSEQLNLTRNNQSGRGVFVLKHPLSCYEEVFGFDIESDGSVGTLAVPGVIMNNLNSATVCNPTLPTIPSELKTIINFNLCMGTLKSDTPTSTCKLSCYDDSKCLGLIIILLLANQIDNTVLGYVESSCIPFVILPWHTDSKLND